MSVAVIINPISGGAGTETAKRRAKLAAAVIEAHGDRPEVFITERVGHAREIAAAALQRGARLVLAWGGDGTINEIASALVFGGAPLGIVPAGSGNGLARELGVARRAERAIADALAATPIRMDVGEIDGRYFVSIAGIGFDAQIASRFATAKRRGLLGYIGITMGMLRSYVPLTYRITHGGSTRDARAILVTIANSAQFGNGARIAPRARVDDGELDLVLVQERSRFRTICALPRLFNGTADRFPGCTTARIREAIIEADVPLVYHLDGEPIVGGNRLRVRVHPGALWVAVR